jgi:hypothetical protein
VFVFEAITSQRRQPTLLQIKFGQNDDSSLRRRCLRLSSHHRDRFIDRGNREEFAVTIENRHLQSVVDQDGAVILDIERGLISTLNPTGTYVWLGLRREQSLETIIANLAREPGEEYLMVERDVREFMEDLKQKRLFPR